MPGALKRDAIGVALRPENVLGFREALERGDPGVDYIEILADNYLDGQHLPNAHLAAIVGRIPIVVHSVGLNLLGATPLDGTYITKLKALADRVDAPFVSDHLCWTRTARHSSHDLLPTPSRGDLVEYAAKRAAFVQDFLGRPFGLENVSSYVTFPESDLDEGTFYASVVREAGCHFMLDLNNVYVSARNNAFEVAPYLRGIVRDRILQVHIAGHDAGERGLVVDTHDRAVCDDVWALHRRAWHALGPYPLMLEWDTGMPTWEEQVAHVRVGRKWTDGSALAT